MNIWQPLLTLSDEPGADGPPPLVFLDDQHHPRVGDPRGGEFVIDQFAPHALAILGELPGLRFAMVDGSTGRCVVHVLDEHQVALVEDACRAWREQRDGLPLGLAEQLPVLEAAMGEAR